MKNVVKIFKAFPAYDTYISALYAANPMCANLSYNEQRYFFMKDFFPWILTWSKFNSNPNVEIFETIHNSFFLQNAWMNEHSTPLSCDTLDWQKTIVLQQIKNYCPDVVVIYPPELFDSSFVSDIKSINKNIIVGGYDGMNRLRIQLYDEYDFVITCSKYISRYYEQNGKPTYPLEFAFDPSVNDFINVSENRIPVGFSGSVTPHLHQNRFELLSYLVKRTPIVISSEYYMGNVSSFSLKHSVKAIIRRNKTYFDAFLINRRNIGPKYGLEMYQFLKDSGICLNAHGSAINFAANVRLFEATGVGSCLLTDWKENLGEIFEPDEEVVTYHSKEEAGDKIRFLLHHDEERKRIAKKGQRRTLDQYTYNNRIKGVIQYIQSMV